jgi:hypothetical protein
VPSVDTVITFPLTVMQGDDLNAEEVESVHRVVTTGPGGPENRDLPEWSSLRRNCCQMGCTDGEMEGVIDEENDREDVSEIVGEEESEMVGEADGDAVPPKSMAYPGIMVANRIIRTCKW